MPRSLESLLETGKPIAPHLRKPGLAIDLPPRNTLTLDQLFEEGVLTRRSISRNGFLLLRPFVDRNPWHDRLDALDQLAGPGNFHRDNGGDRTAVCLTFPPQIASYRNVQTAVGVRIEVFDAVAQQIATHEPSITPEEFKLLCRIIKRTRDKLWKGNSPIAVGAGVLESNATLQLQAQNTLVYEAFERFMQHNQELDPMELANILLGFRTIMELRKDIGRVGIEHVGDYVWRHGMELHRRGRKQHFPWNTQYWGDDYDHPDFHEAIAQHTYRHSWQQRDLLIIDNWDSVHAVIPVKRREKFSGGFALREHRTYTGERW